MTAKEAERFWTKVAKDDDGCWLWQACVSRQRLGYGVFGVTREVDGKKVTRNLKAHRVAYELLIGPIPTGKHVLHRCDVPTCVRPDHLFVGTHADNMRDMVAKGRQARTVQDREKNPRTKLTWRQAKEVRERIDKGENCKAVAERFGVTANAIHCIKRRRTWGGITPDLFLRCKRRARGES